MKHKKSLTLSVGVLILFISFIGTLYAQEPAQFDIGVLEHYDYVNGELIVKFKDEVDDEQREEIRQNFNVEIVKQFNYVGAEVWQLPPGMNVVNMVVQLHEDPVFEYAEPNLIITLDLPADFEEAGGFEIQDNNNDRVIPNDPLFDDLWGMYNTGQTGGTEGADIDATRAWTITTGEPILIAIVDTGIDYEHEDLAGNIWEDIGDNFIDPHDDPMDGHGHGTHVAGTVAAIGDNEIGVAGVTWNAELMAVKIFDDAGGTTTTAIVNGIEYTVEQNAQISNHSWGGPFQQIIKDAFEEAKNAGQLVVAAAGNHAADNDINPRFPAAYDLDNIIAVAATNHDDDRANYSAWGPTTVDFAAPGGEDPVFSAPILSTFPNNSYANAWGTSMASPHAAGAAALVWNQNPDWGYLEVKSHLKNTVDILPQWEDLTITGGRLNVFNALIEDDETPPAAITDLTVTDVGQAYVTLEWTVPDVLEGPPSSYDIRYSTDPIVDEEDFENATPVDDPPAALNPGDTQTFTVEPLTPMTEYYFAIKSSDIWGNTSEMSNVVSATTEGAPVLATDPEFFDVNVDASESLTEILDLSNVGEGTLEWSFPGYAVLQLMADPTVESNDPGEFKYMDLAKGEDDPRIGNPVILGAGGPDAFGYTWIDSNEPGGPVFDWFDISDIGEELTDLTGTWDGNTNIDLPFEYQMYDEVWDNITVSVNGWLHFGDYTFGGFINQPIPNPGDPSNLLAVFWDDLDMRTQGTVYTYHDEDNDRFIIQWTDVEKSFDPGSSLTFQAILTPLGGATYQYYDMDGTLNAATVGIENADGTDGLQIVFNADYVENELATKINTPWPEWLAVSPASGELEPNETENVNVTFNTEGLIGETTYTGDMVIFSNDPSKPDHRLPVSMHVVGGEPVLVVSDEELDFGTIIAGTSEELPFSISNEGDAVLSGEINAITLSGDGFISSNNVILEEGFEDEEFPPSGWTRYIMGDDGQQWERTTAQANTGDASAWHNYHFADYVDGWLVTPQLSLGENSILEFYERAAFMTWYEYSGVMISDGSSDPGDGDFVELQEFNDSDGTWRHIEIDLSGYDGQDVYLAFVYQGEDAHTWYIDDVLVTTEPEDPTDVVFTVEPTTFEVHPGLSQDFTVTFSPPEVGEYEGLLSISHNDPSQPDPYEVDLSGEGGAAPVIATDPEELEKTVEAGEVDADILTVLNQGGSNLSFDVSIQYGEEEIIEALRENGIPVSDFYGDRQPAGSVAPDAVTTEGMDMPGTQPFGDFPDAGEILDQWATGLALPWGTGFSGDDNTVWFSNPAIAGGDDHNHEFERDGTPTGRTVLPDWDGSWFADMAWNPNTGTFWQVNVGGDNWIHEFHPEDGPTGNFITGPWGISQRGVAYDPVNDEYYVGGWNAPITIYRIDSDGELIESWPTTISIAGLAFIDGLLYIMENSATDAISVFDVDEGEVIASFLVDGFGDFSGAGLHFDGRNLWAAQQNDQQAYLINSGLQPDWLVVDPESGLVPPDGSMDLDVTYDATELIGGFNYHADIVLSSNDPITPVHTVPVTLSATGDPVIVVDPLDLDFGDPFIGTSRTETVEVVNEGNALLDVTDITSDDDAFTVDITSFTLDPGASQNVEVTFLPDVAGEYEATLLIESNDVDVEVEMFGIGSAFVTIEPDMLTEELDAGETSVQNFTITNEFGDNLPISIFIRAVSGHSPVFQPMLADEDLIRWQQMMELDRTNLHSPDEYTAEREEGAAVQASSTNVMELYAQLAAEVGEIGYGNDMGVDGGHIVSFDLGLPEELTILDDEVDSFAGNFIFGDEDHIYFIDNEDNYLKTYRLDDGAIEVIGQLETVSPDEGWTDMETDFTDGTTYVTTYSGTANTNRLYILDPQAAELELVGEFHTGINIAFAIDDQGQGYGHSITDDVILLVDLDTAEYEVLGETGIDANFAQSMTYDHATGQLLMAAYMGMFAPIPGELRYVDRETGATTPIGPLGPAGDANEITWFATPGVGIHWLSVNLIQGVLPPDATLTLEAHFDATELIEGEYEANIVIQGDEFEGVPTAKLPVSLSVSGEPEIWLSLEEMDFGEVFENDVSESQLVTIRNDGTANLNIIDVNIDHDYFHFEGETEFTLVPDESKVFEVWFSPESVGEFTATLAFEGDEVSGEVMLFGEGIPAPEIAVDPESFELQAYPGQIQEHTLDLSNIGGNPLDYEIVIGVHNPAMNDDYEVLLDEDFDGPFPPEGWELLFNGNPVDEAGSNWQLSDSDNAGGEAPEAEFYWLPTTVANQQMVTPALDTEGVTELYVEFRHYVNTWGTDYELRLETSADGGDTWNVVDTWPAADLPATLESYVLEEEHGVGSDQFMVAWTFDGDSWDINWWNVDDVLIYYELVPWLIVDPMEGTVDPAETDVIDITIDATEIEPGVYESGLIIHSNDPVTPIEFVPFTLNVIESLIVSALPEEGDEYVHPNEEFIVPIEVTSLDDLEVYSYQLTLEFDAALLEATEVIFDGTLTEGEFAAYNIEEGKVLVAAADDPTNPEGGDISSMPVLFQIEGEGTLVYVKFKAKEALGSTMLELTEMMFNEGEPPASTIDGEVEVVPLYGDVALNLQVTSLDASLVLQHVVNLIDLTEVQQIAGNVSGGDAVTALDASLILQYVVGIIDEFPVEQMDAMIAADDDSDLQRMNVDVVPSASGTVSFDGLDRSGDYLQIPIKVEEGESIYSMKLSLEYDADLITIQDIRSNLPDGWISNFNAEDGRLLIAMAGASELPDGIAGQLLIDIDDETAESMLSGDVILNEGNPRPIEMSIRDIPEEFKLTQNFPNPFNPVTTIQYQLPQDARVQLVIYNQLGQQVKTLVDEEQAAGYYRIEWNATNDAGMPVSSGMYIYRLQTGEFSDVKRMIFLK